MAELSTAEEAVHACCATEQQATCCEPSAKAECCGGQRDRCGCDASVTRPSSALGRLASSKGPIPGSD
jgi:hypothetical protein